MIKRAVICGCLSDSSSGKANELVLNYYLSSEILKAENNFSIIIKINSKH